MDLPHPTPRGIISLFTKIRQFAGYLIAGIFLFFLIKPLMQTHTYLKDITSDVQVHWLILSFGVLLCYRSIYTLPFATLLHGMTQKQISFRLVFTLFHLANITRYLPGRIWGVVRILSLSKWKDASVLTACYAFAWIVGFSSFLTPGGLGVRETLLGLLLSHYIFFSQATLIALLCRVWILSAEILLAGVAFFLDRNQNRESEQYF